jgi:CRISPR-associated protein Csc3
MIGDSNGNERHDAVIEPELLTIKLIREAILRENPNDRALADFAQLVVPNLLRELVGVTAKGGLWVEQRLAEGMKSDRNLGDQSLTAHLLNGLLPVIMLIRELRALGTDVAIYLDERAYRFFIAGYILHDWEKFPDVEEKIKARFGVGFKPDPLKHRDLVAEIVAEWATRLGLDRFLAAGGLGQLAHHLGTLVYIAQNTQDKHDTHRPTRGFNLLLPDRPLLLCTDLTKMADKLASIVKHPADIQTQSIESLLFQLSEGELQFTHHTIAEVRGMLTNVINNAAIELHRAAGYRPFLFFPNGVAYVGSKAAAAVDLAKLPDAVVARVRQLCASKLKRRHVGFGRDGKGLKFADYYWLFFDPAELAQVCAAAACRMIVNPASDKRSASLAEFQRKGLLPKTMDVEFGADSRIDQLAEFCDITERKVWQQTCQERRLAKAVDLTGRILDHLKLGAERPQFDLIANLNEAIRQAGEKGNTGGVPLAWYYTAAQYFKQPSNKGRSADDVAELIARLADAIAEMISDAIPPSEQDGWGDMRDYVRMMVSLPAINKSLNVTPFLAELGRYEKTKARGGGKPCSLCNSPYSVEKQMESGVLFAPQVFTNKQSLHSSQALRHICSICAAEMMLRQILMNKTAASGGDFEGAKFRYLYIYPTYYFSAETNRFLRSASQKLAAANFRTGVRDQLVNPQTREVNFEIADFQRLDHLLIDEQLDLDKDRFFKMDYSEDDPVTFFFVGIPPGRDATDTESWVMPVFLSLTLPFVFDVKVVVSESPAPLFASGAEFDETVFIDAPHSFAELLIAKENKNAVGAAKLRLRLDEIKSNLQRVAASYVIHLDANARQSKSGYDANWGRLSDLARDMASSPLYVFHYLHVWLRKQGFDALPTDRVREYLKLYEFIDPEQKAMNHPRNLTELYRRFYRARGFKANAILKPIDFAADAILKADRSLFTHDSGALTDSVAGTLNRLMDRVINSSAEGWSPIRESEVRRRAVREFAEYFVNDLFLRALRGDVARLAGVQLNLLRDACDTLYRELEDRERAERKAKAAAAGADVNSDSTNEEELEG